MTTPVELAAIRDHYDRLSPLYRRFWGAHLHHGFWENGESLPQAQCKLVERLARIAGIAPEARVLDIGCGLGGSAIWLGRELGCSVLGITLSPVQVEIARRRARAAGVQERVQFAVLDANQLERFETTFDAVWVIECSEHLFDKPDFIARCGRVLQPGGSLALCAWLAQPVSAAQRELVATVCRGMLCPSLASRDDYIAWMEAGGFACNYAEDITRRVEPTWARACAVLQRPAVRAILRASNRATREFAATFAMIQTAYAEGAMSYGMFAARKRV